MNLTTLGWDGGWAEALADHEDPRALVPARVIAVHRGRSRWRETTSTRSCPSRARWRPRPRRPSDLPAVGDWVALREGAAIRHVLPRRTLLARADDDGREEALAANVDLCLVTTSLDLDLNLRRLERFVALARSGGVEVAAGVHEGRPVARPGRRRRPTSRRPSASRRSCSRAHDGWGVGALRARLEPRRTAALVGMSGVGKSTLVNLLLGEERQRDAGGAREATPAGATRRPTASCSCSTTARC